MAWKLLATRSRLLCVLSLALISISFILYHTWPYARYIIDDKLPSNSLSSTHHEDFIDTKFDFQQDLPSLKQPDIDLSIYKNHKPHNYVYDTKQKTFATFLCTPNASIHDPYFSATLNLVYRNLWSPDISSRTHPFTVFVAPFVTQEQRDILAGAGAAIQELGLLPWEPNTPGVWSRWRDQFSKLHFWNQTQYSTIAFMDSDAFPIKNIDSVFDDAKMQRCIEDKLTEDDKGTEDDDGLCDYIFAGVENLGGGVNGGFLVVKPNNAMHERLLRNYVKVDKYDNSVAEQSFFQWQFGLNGAFPAQMLPRKYNAFFPTADDEGKVNVIHEKLWAFSDSVSHWMTNIWPVGWQEMIDFFNSPEFAKAREADGLSPTLSR